MSDSLFPSQTVAYGTLASPAMVTFTRPANTTAYTAKDAVSDSITAPTILTFANIARLAGGSGYVVRAHAFTNQAANVARLRLHLFHTLAAGINDNAAFISSYATRGNRVAMLDFPAFQTDGSGSDLAWAQSLDLRVPFACAAGSRNLFGLVSTLDGFTPASGQSFAFVLVADVN